MFQGMPDGHTREAQVTPARRKSHPRGAPQTTSQNTLFVSVFLHTFVKTCSTPLLDVQEVHAIVEMLKIFLRVRRPLKIIPCFPFNVKIGLNV